MSARTVQTDYFRELCVALEHRWNPERLFVILTAYFDEADTHGPMPTIILSCFVGHAYQWQQFESELTKLQKRFGFKVFHSKHFRSKRGEFSGWSDHKRHNLVVALTDLISTTLISGISIHLERDRYLSEYRSPPIPRKLHLDSQYGVCFRGCMGALLQNMQERGNTDRLNIIMENGHENVWDCQRIFFDLQKRFKRTGKDILGTWTLETKENCRPLMIADMLTNAHSLMRSKLRRGIPASSFPRATPETKGALQFIELAPQALRDLKREFEELRKLEIDAWRAARASRKTASGDLSS